MSKKDKLTPKQIKNWRKTLCAMIGPYALIIPDKEVQKFRDSIQAQIDEKSKGKNDG